MSGTDPSEAEALPVLSLWQPWASLVALGIKTVETRNRQAPKTIVGKRIAIQATKRKPTEDQRVGCYRIHEMADDSWAMFTDEHTVEDGDLTSSVPVPLGCIVATARLVASIPMVSGDDVYDDVNHCRTDKTGFVWIGPRGLEHYRWNGTRYELILMEDIEDQRSYGDFQPGRWAWLLSDVEPIDPPVPFIGGQGFSKRWVRP